MRLARLRNQMLIAMGLPACWVQQAPAPSPPDPAPPARPVVAGAFNPESCVIDTIPETVCGRRDEQRTSGCGPRGDTLGTYGESELPITKQTGRAAFEKFVYDRAATAAYRDKLTGLETSLEDHCCYSHCTALTIGAPADLPLPPNHRVEYRCVPEPPNGTSLPAGANHACPAGVSFDNVLRPYSSNGFPGSCCYSIAVRDPYPHRRPYKGRAARVDGAPRYADVADGAAWRSAGIAIDASTLPPAVRERLAAIWLEAARMEHASIASFSALSLRLLALGAPPDLIAATHAAALDEIEHARVAFALASTYAGRALGAATFGEAAKLAVGGTLADLARETFVDGCINETVASLEAARAADTAEDPAIAGALRRIAEDEGRHAELAWAIVAWCVRAEPSLLADLRGLLHDPAAVADQPAGLACHGVLDGPALSQVRADVLLEVVAPCLAALGHDRYGSQNPG